MDGGTRSARARGARPLAVAVAVLLLVSGCFGRAAPSGPVTLPPDYTMVIGSASLDLFRDLAGSVIPLSPDQARLVGAGYGVDFDAVAVATTLPGQPFAQIAGPDAIEDLGSTVRDQAASAGHEFVLAHVPADGHLPEPEGGYDTPLFWDWQVTVAGQPRVLHSDDYTPCLCTGSVIVIDVPAGAPVELGAVVGGRAQWIDLRTGAVH